MANGGPAQRITADKVRLKVVWRELNPIQLVCDPQQPDGWQALIACAINRLGQYYTSPAVLVTGPIATQNSPISSL